MSVLGTAVCLAAAYRLRDTPLFGAAATVAGLSALAVVGAAVLGRREGSTPRLATAFKHVTAALGGFFLFVSFALP